MLALAGLLAPFMGAISEYPVAQYLQVPARAVPAAVGMPFELSEYPESHVIVVWAVPTHEEEENGTPVGKEDVARYPLVQYMQSPVRDPADEAPVFVPETGAWSE